ncbi:MAG TPA: type II secretion system protein [Albitalea sp.]
MGPRRTAQRGFTYVVVLAWIAVTGIGAAAVGTMWHTAHVRDNERELLAIGDEFRRAIGSYRAFVPPGQTGVARRFPDSLEALVRDPRHPGVVRHLRRIHVDPMTGTAEWGLLRGPDGGIVGVHSLAQGRPLRRTGFAPLDETFENAERYADWHFIHREPGRPAPPVGWKEAPPPR